MMKLIKLELAKNKLGAYIFASLCIFTFGVGFCFLAGFSPQLDVAMPLSLDVLIFSEWSNFISLISVLFVTLFSVLSAVMHTKFTVEEYTGKGAILLFSYPLSKSKILFAKCSIVFFFTVVALMVSNIVAIGIFAIFSNTFGIMPDLFSTLMIQDLLTTSVVSALLSASVGLVAMRVGFWKKSLVATVVTSFLLISPFGNIVSFFPQYSATIQLIVMCVLLVISILIVVELLSKVNKMEAL